MSDPIVVAGDVHLGAATADVEAFDAFLDDLRDGTVPAGRLVLVGDVWDLVRRDPFGAAFETSETVTRLKRLTRRLPVDLVVGNHDAALRGLDGDRYGVDFRDGLVLDSGGTSVRFCHGNGFDRLQSDRVSRYLAGPGDRGDVDPTRGLKDPVVARLREGVRTGRRQLRSAVRAARGLEPDPGAVFGRRERRAHRYLAAIPEDKLVYGHTHSPYVHPDNVAANPGSWKTTAPVHGTYLVVEDGHIALRRHGDPGAAVAAGRAAGG